MKDSPLLAALAAVGAALLIVGGVALERALAPKTCEERGGAVEMYDCHAAITCHGADGRIPGFIRYPTKHCLERCIGGEP